jgi:hypothetical protein
MDYAEYVSETWQVMVKYLVSKSLFGKLIKKETE